MARLSITPSVTIARELEMRGQRFDAWCAERGYDVGQVARALDAGADLEDVALSELAEFVGVSRASLGREAA